ncbi:MAG: septum formation initiator family protein [Acidobacteria bacterium]|nr:septum formation initiator family protein [Acidobacteriota bacterium]
MAFGAQKLHGLSGRIARTGEEIYQRRRRIATGAVAMLAIALGYHVVFGQNGLITFQQKRLEAKDLDGEVKRLSVENDRLRDHVGRLKEDPNAIEHAARESLHYTRPDEIIYTLPTDPAKK